MDEDVNYWLVSTNEKGRRVCLPAHAPVLVGRGEHNHLVLDDYRISRQHARVAPERDGYVVYDLNSVNGTFVNGAPVRRQRLELNDEITFGPFAFRFERLLDAAPSGGKVAKRRANDVWRAVESVTQMSDPRVVKSFRAKQPTVDLNLLEVAHRNLGTLFTFVQAIGKTIDRNELLQLMTTSVLEIFPAAVSVSVHLRAAPDEGGARYELANFSGGDPTDPPRLPDEISDAVVRAGCAVFDTWSEPAATSGATMYAPLVERGEALGILCVATDGRLHNFTLADLELLDGMAASSTIMLQNTRMHVESLARERLRRDLELAAQIQKSFLPREIISVAGVEFLAAYRAAYTVGGDFYDVFWVGPNHLAVFIGDISGKGIAAALLMARLSGEIRVAALAHVSPAPVLSILNEVIIGRNQPELFFTAIYMTLDVMTGEVVLANAGHPSPYLCHADGSIEAVTGGAATAVGMFEDPGFAPTHFRLADGDSLVLYTDGVVEAANADGVLYGQRRLETCLAGVAANPEEISRRLLRSVEQHQMRTPPNDDLTVLICHRSRELGLSLQPRRISDIPRGARDTYSPPAARPSQPTIPDTDEVEGDFTGRR